MAASSFWDLRFVFIDALCLGEVTSVVMLEPDNYIISILLRASILCNFTVLCESGSFLQCGNCLQV